MHRITVKWLVTIVGVMIIGLGLMGSVSYSVVTNHYRHHLESSLIDRADAYAEILSVDFDAKTLRHVAGMEREPLTGVFVFSREGELLIASGEGDEAMTESVHGWILQESGRVLEAENSDGKNRLVVKSPFQQKGEQAGIVVLVADMAWLESTLRSLQLVLILAGVGALLVAGGLSLLLSRRIVQPVLAIQKTAERLAKGDYHVRVPVNGRDEVASLGMRMNQLAESLHHYRTSRREFLSNVAHELRTPLTYLKGYATLLQESALSEERRRKLVGVIREQSDRLEYLVNDLVTLTRLDEGRIELRLQRVDLVAQLQAVMEEIRPLAMTRGIRTVLQSSPGTFIEAEVDPFRFHQIMLNLLDNALRYSKKEGTVTVSVSEEPDGAKVTVSDEGIGMAPEELSRIWDRFYRVEKSRSRRYGGSGLGLSIVKWLVDLHGGRIDVTSAPGKGTTFVLRFPLTEPGVHRKEG